LGRTPGGGRQSRRGKPEDCERSAGAGPAPSFPVTSSRPGKPAAPAPPAAARRGRYPPGSTPAVRFRPETRSRVGLLVRALRHAVLLRLRVRRLRLRRGPELVRLGALHEHLELRLLARRGA